MWYKRKIVLVWALIGVIISYFLIFIVVLPGGKDPDRMRTIGSRTDLMDWATLLRKFVENGGHLNDGDELHFLKDEGVDISLFCTNDYFGQAYRYYTDQIGPYVMSPGADGVVGSDDDIRVYLDAGKVP